MHHLKRYFHVPFVILIAWAFLHSLYGMFQDGIISVWLGVLIAVVPMMAYLFQAMVIGLARTSHKATWMYTPALAGVALILWLNSGQNPAQPLPVIPLFYCVFVGFIYPLVYVFWLTQLPSRDNPMLEVGQPLPDFEMTNTQGKTYTAAEVQQQPALLMFIRGNWCPLCMAQIKEVAELYRELANRGVQIFMLGSQSQEHTEELASHFDVPMNFIADEGNVIAKRLGIEHVKGTSSRNTSYDEDTVLPTVLITDNTGKIIFADLTDNYRVRPEPETFIQALDEAGIAAA